jgi:hypothetical protein
LTVSLEGEPKARVLAESTTAGFEGAHFSPDGKWVVDQTGESGDQEVWVAAFPSFDRRRRISSHGGRQPIWRSDNREIFYLQADGAFMSVQVTSAPSRPDEIDFAAPVKLFDSPIPRPTANTDQYAVARDGKRFLSVQPRKDQTDALAPITVVVNWRSGK